jgi:GNAT superfamily N-acetyltransferase
MQLRTMTEADIPAGMRLKEISGWNQTSADWQRFLSASPQGCFVAEIDGAVRGTSATITYENRFAWIGMVLVDPDYRSRGIGTALLQRAIDHIDSIGVPCAKLDATPAGKPIYERLGFKSEFEIARWILRREPGRPQHIAPETMPSPLLERLLLADREAFGADRSALLRSLHHVAPQFTDGLWNAGGIEGYCFARQGSFADHLGPWIAKDQATGAHLLDNFLARSVRDTIIVDCPSHNIAVKRALQSRGFVVSRPLTRMFRGDNQFPDRPDLLCGIMGPEFG